MWDVRTGAIGWESGGPADSGLLLLRRPVVSSVDALRDERILSIGFRGGKRQNAAHGLLIELLPNASNAIALDEGGRVLKSLFPRSGSRAQTRGQAYLPPEPLGREGAERPLDFNDWDHLLTSVPAPEIAEQLIARVAYVSAINVHALLTGAGQSIAQSHERYLELILGAARPAILPSQQPYCHPLWEAN